ncbi:MAG: hypothetical protein KAS32_14625 [Candidatus Peribacteraceae bacterium]|nr:hypothetical protein [Candidatus Peribacteraceae bacterium]
MDRLSILAMKGGHRIISDTDPHNTYDFYGFIPHEDTVFASLFIGSDDVAQTGETYIAGIYYGCPNMGAGYYKAFELTSGKITLVLTKESPTKY